MTNNRTFLSAQNGPSVSGYHHQQHGSYHIGIQQGQVHKPVHMERKLKKPLMEKKRRGRINDSLNHLKQNLLHVAPHQRSKLEKADILELTVQHINSLQQQANSVEQHFAKGFLLCAEAVMRYVSSGAPVERSAFSSGLKSHLHSALEQATANNRATQNLHVHIPNTTVIASSTRTDSSAGCYQDSSNNNNNGSQFDRHTSATPPMVMSPTNSNSSSSCSSSSSSMDSGSISPMSSRQCETPGSIAGSKIVWRPW